MGELEGESGGGGVSSAGEVGLHRLGATTAKFREGTRVGNVFSLTHRFDETNPFLYGVGQPVMSSERWPSSVGIEPEIWF